MSLCDVRPSVCLCVRPYVWLSVCMSVNFSCPLHIFLTDWRVLWNFGQTFTIPRWCVGLITEPCPVKVKVTIQSTNGNVLCLLYNFKTFKDFFMKLCINIKHHRRCAEKRKGNLSSSYDVIMPLCIYFISSFLVSSIFPSRNDRFFFFFFFFFCFFFVIVFLLFFFSNFVLMFSSWLNRLGWRLMSYFNVTVQMIMFPICLFNCHLCLRTHLFYKWSYLKSFLKLWKDCWHASSRN